MKYHEIRLNTIKYVQVRFTKGTGQTWYLQGESNSKTGSYSVRSLSDRFLQGTLLLRIVSIGTGSWNSKVWQSSFPDISTNDDGQTCRECLRIVEWQTFEHQRLSIIDILVARVAPIVLRHRLWTPYLSKHIPCEHRTS